MKNKQKYAIVYTGKQDKNSMPAPHPSEQNVPLPPEVGTLPPALPQEVPAAPENAPRFSVRRVARAAGSLVRRHRHGRQTVPAEVDHPAAPASGDQIIPAPESQPHEASRQEAGEALSERGERFWGAQSSIEPAPTFREQLAEVTAHPEAHSETITAKPFAVFDGDHQRTKVTFTEAEGLQNLRSFIDIVKQEAGADTGETGAKILAEAEQLEATLSLLRGKEYEIASDNLAAMWAEYVAQGPDYVINLFTRPQQGDVRKSYHEVTDGVYERFLQKVAGTPLADRIRRDPETWIDNPNAKLVVADDWLISSHTLGKLMKEAVNNANRLGLPGLKQKAEGHTLITQAERLGVRDSHAAGFPYTVRTNYVAQDGPVALSGTKASADYGFEIPLERMQKYLADRGIETETPWLVNIQRAYGADAALGAEDMRMLERAAVLNGEIIAAKNEEHRLRDELNRHPATGISDRVGEAMEARRAASRELSELKQAFYARQQ